MSQRNERSAQPELDGVNHWLIHHAACRAPESLSSRLEEEWLADLESRSSALSKLSFAVGCCWAAMVIVNDFPRSRVPAVSSAVAASSAATANSAAAASSVATARGLIVLADRNFGYFSLRPGTLFLIVGIHAALFCGVITTLSHAREWATPTKAQNQVLSALPLEIEITDFLPGK